MKQLLEQISLPFKINYAEIHYKVPGFPTFIHRKMPEIIFDAPSRLNPGKDLPISLIIKDSHLFPVKLKNLSLCTHGGKMLYKEDLDLSLNSLIFSRIIYIPASLLKDYRNFSLDIVPRLTFEIGGKIRSVRCHNYRQLSHKPLSVYISGDTLPQSSYYAWGDFHVHSFYTHDQVEFGAPLDVISASVKAMGLSLIAVTDHSYDLDDLPGEYVKPDKELTRWNALDKDISEADSSLTFIRGEEISCANEKYKTIHFLVYNHDKYIPGNADSSEDGFFIQSQQRYVDILDELPKTIPTYAAHPAEKPPLGERLFLKRGKWSIKHSPAITGFQIFNGYVDNSVRKAFKEWVSVILSGKRQFLLAGNDSHGNMNKVSEIILPNMFLGEGHRHLLGKHRSGLLYAEDKESAIKALNNGHSIVSNSYSVYISLKDAAGKIYLPGDCCSQGEYSLHLEADSTREFGPFKQIHIFFGSLPHKNEEIILSRKGLSYHIEENKILQLKEAGYIRAAVTDHSKWTRFAFSNPIWVGGDR